MTTVEQTDSEDAVLYDVRFRRELHVLRQASGTTVVTRTRAMGEGGGLV